MSNQINILFLAANPDDEARLRLDDEHRQIKAKIRASEHRKFVNLDSSLAVRPKDLLADLNRMKRPSIVHFSGHGNKVGSLFLMDNERRTFEVSAEMLVKIFSSLKYSIDLVVLNACYSEVQAKAILDSGKVECVIGMSDLISDDAAIAFAESFYLAIGSGLSIKGAFTQGLLGIDFSKLPEGKTPILRSRRNINPDNIFLLETAEHSSKSKMQSIPTLSSNLDIDQAFKELISGDPLQARDALDLINDRPPKDLLEKCFSYRMDIVANHSCRELFSRSPEYSANLILNKIDQKDNAIDAASLCVPEHSSYIGGDLVRRLLDPPISHDRLPWIVAIGRMELQADGPYALEIFFLGRPSERKLGFSVDLAPDDILEGWRASARIFVGAKKEFEVQNSAETFAKVVSATKLHHYESYTSDPTLRIILNRCQGPQADEVMKWVGAENTTLRSLAWRTLEDLRFSRIVPRVVEVLDSKLSEEARFTALRILAKSRGKEGVNWLLHHQKDPKVRTMLSLCAEKLSDRELAISVLCESIERFKVSWQDLRTIGRAKLHELRHYVDEKLSSEEPFERACAFLALARLDGAKVRNDIVRSVEEAGAHPLERCICTLALLHVEPALYPDLEQNFREYLKTTSWLAHAEIKEDIIEELNGTGNIEATRLATAWEPFYRAKPNYLNPF